jgi:hypothetical protein
LRSTEIVAVHCWAATGAATTGGGASVGTFPVLWSYPQSSQNLLPPARGAPQFGQGAPAAAAGPADGVDAGAPACAESDAEAAAATGIDTVVAPPIFAPHSSQKSSVLDV